MPVICSWIHFLILTVFSMEKHLPLVGSNHKNTFKTKAKLLNFKNKIKKSKDQTAFRSKSRLLPTFPNFIPYLFSLGLSILAILALYVPRLLCPCHPQAFAHFGFLWIAVMWCLPPDPAPFLRLTQTYPLDISSLDITSSGKPFLRPVLGPYV